MNIIEEKMDYLDRQNMGKLIKELPSQIQWVEEKFSKISLPHNEFNKVLFSGLGGSAIAGDIVAGYLRDDFPYPVYINRSYSLPEWVDDKTLTFIISYSGNTEETLSSFKEALEKNSKIIGISSNGELKKLCKEKSVPFLEIPQGFPPRAALGYLFFSLLFSLRSLGYWKKMEEIEETKETLRKLSLELSWSNPDNMAFDIAKRIKNSVPIIYTASDYLYGVAMRWKTQMNENAKNPCYWHVFPELDHNEIMGWEGIKKNIFSFVVLMDKKEKMRMIKRIENTIKIMKDSQLDPIVINSQGESLLSRIFSLLYIGDWVSFYLAILNEVNPTEIKSIDRLKEMMKG